MIEKIIIEYLSNLMNVPVYAEIPIKAPEEFIVIYKIDGGLKNHIKAATLNIECSSKSNYDVALLNEQVKEHLLNATVLDEISSANLGGEQSNIDTKTKSYRYESQFNFYYY